MSDRPPGIFSTASRTRARIRYAAGLRRFFTDRPSPRQCADAVAAQHARREGAFLDIVRRGIYDNRRSPYGRLLAAAGIEYGDVVALVSRSGVEGTLGRLYAEGVRLSVDEFKGRVPIRRLGLEWRATIDDFDNPLLRRHYEARTGGSRGGGSRLAIDLDLLAYEAAYLSLCLRGFGLERMPFAAWRPVPPGLAGMKGMLRRAHLGLPTEAWLSQYRYPRQPQALKFALLTAATVAASRRFGSPVPAPRYAPLERAADVARWLAARACCGAAIHFDTNWSTAVRTCLSAADQGLDLSGTFFRVGGEPGTAARRAAIEAVGGRFAAHYSMGEVGWIGIACPHREALDEVHLMTDKLAVIQPPGSGSSPAARALVLTTLLPTCPKILLNVDTGDNAVLGRRDCDCPAGSIGLNTTAHSIVSHEKLTTEGMSFVGSEIAWLLEEALPARFGGGVGDYQLAEERTETLSRVTVVVDPSVRPVPDAEVIETTLASLASLGAGQRLMAEQWAQAGTLRVARRSPYVTAGGKQGHLHVVGAATPAQPG